MRRQVVCSGRSGRLARLAQVWHASLLGAVLLLAISSCRKQNSGSPEGDVPSGVQATQKTASKVLDVSSCTKVEVRYFPSALEYLTRDPVERGLLSEEELEYLGTEEVFVAEDPNYITSLARALALATYDGPAHGHVRTKRIARFECCCDDKSLGAFVVIGDVIQLKQEVVQIPFGLRTARVHLSVRGSHRLSDALLVRGISSDSLTRFVHSTLAAVRILRLRNGVTG